MSIPPTEGKSLLLTVLRQKKVKTSETHILPKLLRWYTTLVKTQSANPMKKHKRTFASISVKEKKNAQKNPLTDTGCIPLLTNLETREIC